jgi:WD40 repeat protein
VHIWNAQDFSKITTINSGIWANRLAFSPDGSKVLVAGTSSSTAKIYDANTGSELGSVKPTGSILWSCTWSPDGKYIAAGTEGGGVYVYDAENFSLVAQLSPTFNDQILDIDFSRDGKFVAVGFDEGDVGVWTTDNWTRVTHVKALSATFAMAGLMDTVFGANSDVIFAGGGEGKLVILAAEGGGVLKEIGLPNPIWALDVSGDGSKVAIAMDNGDLIIVGLPGN